MMKGNSAVPDRWYVKMIPIAHTKVKQNDRISRKFIILWYSRFTPCLTMEMVMKTIGLIGGMSWESSIEYYRIINESVQQRLGGVHSAACVMVSVDFEPYNTWMRERNWGEIEAGLVKAAQQVDRAGADLLLLCTNTMHKLAGPIQAAVSIPLLHIADSAGQAAVNLGARRVGLLGTRFTMEEDFYRGRLEDKFGMEVLTPPLEERKVVARVIFEELVVGRVLPESREAYRKIIAGLEERGAQAVILGCTEIGLLVKPDDSSLALLDTTRLHAEAAVAAALEGQA